MLRHCTLAVLIIGCHTGKTMVDSDSPVVDDTAADLDADDDGYPAQNDCDETDAEVHPGAEEICDGRDNNCDGQIDEGVTQTWYADTDADGFGDPAVTSEACEQPAGFVSTASDCDDSDPQTHPDASERCDAVDNDCDGEIDEDVTLVWYADLDGDGHGAADSPLEDCDPPAGYTDSDADCDDTDAAISPDAEERCDARDNDCDGTVDEDDATDASVWYLDADGDGFGDPDTSTTACDAPSSYTDNASDCDDADTSVNPDATEYCDEIDNDCDGTVDEDDAADARVWHPDADGDGFGDPDTTTTACDAPPGLLEDASDCDDALPRVNPDATEYCDDIDNDCDGTVDEDDAADARVWHPDADGDGFGDPDTAVIACDAPRRHLEDDSDCDDADTSVNPDATEYCDEIDNDCDGTVDEDDAVDAPTWYADLDGDGYGDPDNTATACAPPADHLEDRSDCADSDADAYPGSTATETPGDGIDTDCDGIDACTDLSCDGIPDLAIGTYYSGASYVVDSQLYYGSGTDFSDGDVDAIAGTGTHDILAEDLDGDGYIDVVLATYYTGSSYYGSSYVYWGGPSGYSSDNRQDIATGGARTVTAEDLNGDEYLDLVFVGYYVGSYYSYTYVYYGSARGYSTGAVDYLYATGAIRSAAADLDSDGDTDLVICRHYAYTYDIDSSIYWNDGGRFSDSDRTDLASNGCLDLEIEDLDGDGWQDIVFASYATDATGTDTESQVYWGSADGYSEDDLTELPTTGTLSVAPGDYNGDGYRDLAFGSFHTGTSYSSNAIVYYGDADGYDPSVYDTLPCIGTWQIGSGDLDLDGYDDLVLPSYQSDSGFGANTYVYYGAAAGIGGSPDVLGTVGTSDVGIGDLDGNGYPELVFNHYYSGTWSTLVGSTIYWGDGGGYSGSVSTVLDTAGTWAPPALVGDTDW